MIPVSESYLFQRWPLQFFLSNSDERQHRNKIFMFFFTTLFFPIIHIVFLSYRLKKSITKILNLLVLLYSSGYINYLFQFLDKRNTNCNCKPNSHASMLETVNTYLANSAHKNSCRHVIL